MNRIILTLLAGMLLAMPVSAADKNPVVVMETSKGTIKIELFPEKAPATVKNFLAYVDDKFFDDVVFHRVIKDFMIQGGGFDKGLKEKGTKDPIKNEASNGLSNERGTIAMARTDDPDSATAQFFINHKDNTNKLDPGKFSKEGYCVFGKVIEGMDVVDKIAEVKTGKKTFQVKSGQKAEFKDVPEEDVIIKSVRKVESK